MNTEPVVIRIEELHDFDKIERGEPTPTQPRAKLDLDTVVQYAGDMEAGDSFPPIDVFRDESGETYLADGFHRVHAALYLHREEIAARIHPGSLRDAILYSASANSKHGLRRSNEDKRRAVECLLRDEEWQQWSDAEIARWCAVDPKTVGNLRRDLVASMEIPELENRKFVRDGKEITMHTAGIGAGQADPEAGNEDRDDLAAWDQHAAGPSGQEAARPVPTSRLHWRERWEQVKRDHPNQVVFIRGKPQVSLWLVLGADAVRVARILGVDPAVLENMPPTIEAIRLRLPSESIGGPKPAWFVGLVRALDEQIFVYDEESEGFARAAQAVPASEILPRSLPANAFEPIEPAAPPQETQPPATQSPAAPPPPTNGNNVEAYELYTPAWLVERARRALGGKIHLDPASCHEAQQIVQADWYLSLAEDGLARPWESDAVFVNPPYGIGYNDDWAAKIVEEFESGRAGQIIALVPAATGAPWFRLYADYPRCFLSQRVDFYGPADKGHGARFDSAVIALGVDPQDFAAAFGDLGDIYVRYTGPQAAESRLDPDAPGRYLFGLAEGLDLEETRLVTLQIPELVFHDYLADLDTTIATETDPVWKALLGLMRSRVKTQSGLLIQTAEKVRAFPEQLEALRERIAHAKDLGELRQVNHDLSQLRLGDYATDKLVEEIQALSSARLKEIASGITPDGDKDREEAAR